VKIRALILAAALGLTTNQATAQNGMVWQAYHGGASAGRAGIELFFGVPRSGDLLISGSCDISGPEPRVRLTLYSENLPAPPGTMLPVDITSPGRISSPVQAYNHGYDDFSGLTRLEANLSLDDPIWEIFAAPAPIAYRAEGGTTPIVLRGDPLAIQDFLGTCAERGGPTCAALPRSTETGEILALPVTNSARGARRIVWIGPDGTLSEVGLIAQNQTLTLETDAGHVWMFTDDQGRCVEARRGGLSRSGIELFQPGPD